MLTLLFALIVLGSLGTSVALALEILPASPAVLGVVAAVHLAFAVPFFLGYRGYRALHRLVIEGRPELFDLAVSHKAIRARSPWFRRHYRVRRAQGLALTGRPEAALQAAQEALASAEPLEGWERALVLAAEAEANLALEQPFWAAEALRRADEQGVPETQPELAAVRARLDHVEGRVDRAAETLAALTDTRTFPLTPVVRARNRLWLGEALRSLGRDSEAREAFRRAVRAAPKSPYAEAATRALRRAG